MEIVGPACQDLDEEVTEGENDQSDDPQTMMKMRVQATIPSMILLRVEVSKNETNEALK